MNKAIKEGIILHNDELCLSQDYILKNTDISYNYIRVAASRFSSRSAKGWKHFKMNRVKYFVYDGLPRSSKGKLLPKGQLLAKTFGFDLNSDFIIDIFEKAKLYSFKLFEENNSFEQAYALAITHEASIYIQNNGISFSNRVFFDMMAYIINKTFIDYLPKNGEYLRDKIKEYHDSMNMQI